MYIDRVKAQMLEQFKTAGDTLDISQVANYQVMLMLRNHLVVEIDSVCLAERVAASATIKVSQEIFESDPEYFQNITGEMAKIIGKMYRQISQDFEVSADEILLKMASGISLELG